MGLCAPLVRWIVFGAVFTTHATATVIAATPSNAPIRGILPAGKTNTYQVSACDGTSVLNAEVWDVRQVEHQISGSRATFLLFMAQGVLPEATQPSSADSTDWTFQPYNKVASDYDGYQLMRPYQFIRQTHSSQCQPACSAPCPTCWYIQLLNSQLYNSADLTFELRLTCQAPADQQICPSPALNNTQPYLPKPQCSGSGNCRVFDPVCTDAAFQQGECTYCDCDEGWGDVGCNVPAPNLQLGAVKAFSTSPGGWQYYNLALDSYPAGGTILVEMNRTRGDPVLFLKRHDEGFARNAVPSFQDYDFFADSSSYKERLNYHSIKRKSARNAGYYVAVFNNNKYLSENATYTLRVRWAAAGTRMCAFDCHGHGQCALVLQEPTCVCFPGFGGVYCEGSQQAQLLGQQSHGFMEPGQWTYFTLTLDHKDPRWQGGLAVAFLTTNGGHPVVLQKYGGIPTLQDSDRVLRAQQGSSGVQSVRLGSNELKAGTYFFAFFNMDYFVHQTYQFIFLVVPTSPQGPDNSLSTYLSLCLGVSLSFCSALSLMLLWRWARQAQTTLPVLSGRTCPGIEPDFIASFPSYPYQAAEGEVEKGIAARAVSTWQPKQENILAVERRASEPAMPSPSKLAAHNMDDEAIKAYEGPSCAVCLGDYEDGEMIRQLPDCHHHFHLECIDQWLATHTTCPMCRRSLLPPQLDPPQPQPAPARPSSHLLPLWSSSAAPDLQQLDTQLALELRPLRAQRQSRDSNDVVEAEGSATALLHDSSSHIS